jgi:hypothetical protein
MTEKLFEILTDDELKRLKAIGLTRNVQVKDLTIGEIDELRKVFFPEGESTTIKDVFVQLKNRKAL